MIYSCSFSKFEFNFSICRKSKDTGSKMESTQHSLTLNEEAFKQIPDHKKPLYVFEWLRYLDKGLVAAQKVSSP